MRAVRSRGNLSTEERMVKILRGAKIAGWRRHLDLPGTPDFAFPKKHVAIMVHGCFWHGCKEHYRAPVENGDYWAKKVMRNMGRDRSARNHLRRVGWSVLTFWEHDLKRVDMVVRRIKRALED